MSFAFDSIMPFKIKLPCQSCEPRRIQHCLRKEECDRSRNSYLKYKDVFGKLSLYKSFQNYVYIILQVVPHYISMVAPYHPASWNQFGKCVKEVVMESTCLSM